MANQTQDRVEHSSPIEYLWNGVIGHAAVIYGPAKAGRKVDLTTADATWTDAARRSLRRPSETIRLGDTGGPD